MSPLENLLISFLKKEVVKNPKIISSLVSHVLTSKNVDPTIIADIVTVLNEALPLIISEIG